MDHSDKPMSYPGPLDLPHAHTKLNHVVKSDEAFTRDGPRADNEYRDLGLAAASGGKIGAKHIRAIRPFEQETGWHPDKVAMFGGALLYTQYGFIKRHMMKKIAGDKPGDLGTDTSRDYVYTEWDGVKRFAEHVATDLDAAPA